MDSAPVLYARLNEPGTAFEPERSLNHASRGADGATLAADHLSNLYVFWHAQPPGGKYESNRRLWMAKSKNGGQTFATEAPVFGDGTGICGCCGSRALAGPDGTLYVMFARQPKSCIVISGCSPLPIAGYRSTGRTYKSGRSALA